MQVFEIVRFNVNSIKFKETKAFFDSLLAEQGIAYGDVSFCFWSGNDSYPKVVKRFPALAPYRCERSDTHTYYFTSNHYTEQGIRGLPAQHRADWEKVLQGIPHTFSWAFMGVLLEGVDWYGDGKQSPAFVKGRQEIDLYNHHYSNYLSNSIRFFKEFDYGNKWNLVHLVIDRTDGEGLRPYPVGFEKILQQLGKPLSRQLICTFDDAERQRWKQADKDFSEAFARFRKRRFIGNTQTSDDLLASVTPLKGIALKSLFTQAGKRYGYSYHSFGQGVYTFRKIVSGGYAYSVELVVPPFSSCLFGTVSVKGYNFAHYLCDGEQITVRDAACAQEYAEQVFQAAVAAEEWERHLLEGYGPTPFWFWKEQQK